MCQGYRAVGKSGLDCSQQYPFLSPRVKINVKPFLNLPQLKKEEDQFQTIESLNPQEPPSLTPMENSFYLKSIPIRSLSKSQQKRSSEKRLPAECSLYGFNRLKTERHGSRRESSASQYSEAKEDCSNEDWLKHCQSDNPPEVKCKYYDAKVKSYVWKEVEILEYFAQQEKFLVKPVTGEKNKLVGRAQLQFQTQNQKQYQRSVNQLKRRLQDRATKQKEVQDLLAISDQEVGSVPKKLEARLADKFARFIHQPIFGDLLNQVRSLYTLYNKKCLNPQKCIKYKRTHRAIEACSNFAVIRERILNRGAFFQRRGANNCLQVVTRRASQMSLDVLETPWSDRLPIEMANLKELYATRNYTKIMSQMRHFMISEIMDQLSDFNLLVSEKQVHEQTSLPAILKRLNLQYSQQLLDSFTRLQQKLLEYLRSFQQNLQNEWRITKTPLLRLEAMTQKKQNVKRFYRKSELDVDEYIIQVEPPLEAVIEILCYPADRIMKLLKAQNKLDSDILTLLLIKPAPLFDLNYLDLSTSESYSLIKRLIQSEYEKCVAVIKKFDPYLFLLEPFTNREINKIFGLDSREKQLISKLNYDSIKRSLIKLSSSSKEIGLQVLNQVNSGLFRLETMHLKAMLQQRSQRYISIMVGKITNLMKSTIERLSVKNEAMYHQSQKVPTNEEQLTELKSFMDQLPMKFAKQSKELTKLQEYFDLLDDFQLGYEKRMFFEYISLRNWPSKIWNFAKLNQSTFKKQELSFLSKLQQEQIEFNCYLIEIQNLYEEIKHISAYQPNQDQVSKMEELKRMIVVADKTVAEFNSREQMFSVPQSQYSQLIYMKQELIPYQQLWSQIDLYQQQKKKWLYGPFNDLIYKDIVQKLIYFVQNATTCMEQFQSTNDEAAVNLTRGYMKSLEEFKSVLWVVEALRIEAFEMKPLFWRELFKECKIANFNPKEEFPLQLLISRGILNVKEQVLSLSNRAEKGWNIEKRLGEIQVKLEGVRIELKPYNGTFIFRNLDEIQQIYDEQLNIISLLKSQPQINMVIGKANQLEHKVVLIEDTLDLGLKCQKNWIYLDPIFNSSDIRKNLINEFNLFQQVDTSFKACMSYLNENPILWQAIEGDKIKGQYAQNLFLLDQVQKSLNKYLEYKRVLFPRFYFLSDEELVEILAKTKDPQQIQSYIFKIFEGIHQVKIHNQSLIVGFKSAHNELVELEKPIEANAGLKQGNVELWLIDLMKAMQGTLKKLELKSLRDFSSTKLEQLKKWPSQCVLLTDQILWTRNTEAAINKQQKLSLQSYSQQLLKVLQETVQLVRDATNEIQKTTFEAMVVLQVHQKDIVYYLAQASISSPFDFDWIAQLRYHMNDKGDLQVKIMNSSVDYGYEYLGRVTRLVVTSLTDRCYRTLLGALHLNYGGAPEGPAGTGKSETVKDLAKAVGMPCIVFNCFDGLNYLAMAKFFKGLASSGAWCCFDEFNRVDPEVLSVVAQYIYTIFRAIKEQKTQFFFQGELIKLIPTCAINVTMNPEYQGRSDLPDNLKLLFRPCVMMIPDFAMIAEIYLYSIGFEFARELSKKIVVCLQLCNQQLSQRDHYDFGMRALKAVLQTTKLLFNATEEVICLTALIRVNLPRLIDQDVALFQAITQDLFPEIQPIMREDVEIEEICADLGFVMDDQFMKKCDQLLCNVQVRHGIINIGATISGKSTVTQALARFQGAQLCKLNPKAVTTDQLFGSVDPITKQWSEGVMTLMIREHLEKQTPIWVLFDGPIDSGWIENLNTLLDDNRKLCLISGEIIKIPSNFVFIFEVEQLIGTSPATISRCGILHFNEVDWMIMVQAFVVEGFDQDYLIRRIRYLVDHSLAWMKSYGETIIPQTQNILVANTLRLLKHMLLAEGESKSNMTVDNIIIFSVTWSIGGGLQQQFRQHYNDFLHRLLRLNKSSLQTKYPEDAGLELPPNDQIDFFSSVFFQSKWVKLSDLQQVVSLTTEVNFNEIILPTIETTRNDFFCQLGLHLLFYGPSGTGKSLSMSKYQQFLINCSGQTTANQLQTLIETKVNKRRRKGHYSAENGHIKILIDDLNMPLREKNGSQSAIELIRQYLEQGGWYDLVTKEFKFICDVTIMSAMQPITGEHNHVTLRCLRHFQILFLSEFDQGSISNMLQVYGEMIFTKLNPSVEVRNFKVTLVNSTIELFERIQQLLRPTPQKCHYSFGLKDLFKIFEGISRVYQIPDRKYLVQLWVHESLRIFCDRLVDEFDIQKMQIILKEKLGTLGFQINEPEDLMWVQMGNKRYEKVENTTTLKNLLQKHLEEYNLVNSQKLFVIFFESVVIHILRIMRIVSGQRGHALCIGMFGSGRQTIAKMANLMAFNKLPQLIESKFWDEQLLMQLREFITIDAAITILFYDSQFKSETMLEDVCNLMCNGEIPHLFPAEERLKIQEEMPFQDFISRCKHNLRVILCMEPSTEKFRKRIRTFPKLLSFSTLYWLSDWPLEAYESIAQKYLPTSLVKPSLNMLEYIQKINEKYNQELRVINYVVPVQFIQMMKLWNHFVLKQRYEAQGAIDKFEIGIIKIIQTEKEVDRIRRQLEDLQPQLIKANEENYQLLQIIKSNKAEADQRRKVCELDEAEFNAKREEANDLRNECQTQLDKALPLLQSATEALDKISKDDMILLKSFTNPPASAAIVLEGLCYAFSEDDKVKSKDKDPPKLQDFWEFSKKHLLNDKLIKRIKAMKLPEIVSLSKAKIAKLQNFVKNPLFDREKVFNASSAAGNLADWIRALLSTYQAVEIIEPKKVQLAQAEAALKKAEELVDQKRKQLDDSMRVLNSLNQEYDKAKQEKDQIQSEVDRIQASLSRAESLTKGLSQEKLSWKSKVESTKLKQTTLFGDCLLSAGAISYFGPYPTQYRDQCLEQWKIMLQKQVKFSESFSLQAATTTLVAINKQIQNKLPNDQFSIDNSIIIQHSKRWPLLVDPSLQGNIWIKHYENQKQLIIINASQPIQGYQSQIEHAINIGYIILLENAGEVVDDSFEPILSSKLDMEHAASKLRQGDKLIDISPDFRMYITTKLSNPKYSAATQLKVSIINFQVTLVGLTEQLHNILLRTEEPSKEEQRIRNIEASFSNQNKQKETQDQILKLLSESQGNILEDSTLIQTLQQSKEEENLIDKAIKQLEYDFQQFNAIRNHYFLAASQPAELFFILNDMCMVEPTYQWSLEFFTGIYQKAIKESVFNKAKRIQNIIDKFTTLFYQYINRSLLEKDKLIFRFLLCTRIMKVSLNDIRICMMGTKSTEAQLEKPATYKWLTQSAWIGLVELMEIMPEVFGWIYEDLRQNPTFWEQFYSSSNPYTVKHGQLSGFHQLMVIKVIKPSLFIQGLNEYIKESLGRLFLENAATTFESFYQESNSHTPLLCILTPGADPRDGISALADKYGMQDRFNHLSLGQGQSQHAKNLIKEATIEGRWILLQNCHVANQFMPELEQIYDKLAFGQLNRDFRLWVTSFPTNILPQNVILKSIKMTYELPRGIKNNMIRSFLQQQKDQFESCQRSYEFKSLFFSLTMFHACILERRKFGAIGWNIPYSFSQSDLEISKDQLRYFLETTNSVPWTTLHYLIAETNYGGRVTDPEDRKLLNVILKDFLNKNILQLGQKLFEDYYIPQPTTLKGYMTSIDQFPIYDAPQVFGLHPNAEIYSAILESKKLSESILALLPQAQGNTTNEPEFEVKQKIRDIFKRLPSQFDLEGISSKYNLVSSNSLNTVLIQELIRYNHLIRNIQKTLQNLKKGMEGHLTINDEMQELFDNLFNNKVPPIWNSFPSTKPLGNWFAELLERVKFMKTWVENGEPEVFWFGGFYFIQGFLTGQLQNFSRKLKIPIDQLTFNYEFLPRESAAPAANGFQGNGLYLIGAEFDFGRNSLEDAQTNVLYTAAPVIKFIPTTNEVSEKMFSCPLYNTHQRKGALTSTGYSINFIRHIQIPIRQSVDFWIKRGVAMVIQAE